MALDLATYCSARLQGLKVYRRTDYGGTHNLANNVLIHPAFGRLVRDFADTSPWAEIHQYPCPEPGERRVAAFFGLPAEAVLLSAGSEDAIKNIFLAFGPGLRSVIRQEPNYVGYYNYPQLFDLPVREVAHRSGEAEFVRGLEQCMRETACALVVLTVPNGITGASLSRPALEALLDRAAEQGHLVLLDAAYVSFNAFDYTHLASSADNLLIVRTFSKSFGFAGLRCGMIAGSPRLLGLLRRLNVGRRCPP